MKILFTGKTDFQYNRVLVLLEGLKHIGDVTVEFFPIVERKLFDKTAFLRSQEDVDFIYIPPFRHRDVKFIKKYSTKPVIFDPLISKYLTKVVDYGHFWKAPIKYFLDRIAFSNADYLIVDTIEHQQYFARKFGFDINKIGIVPVGVDTNMFYPTGRSENEIFKVGFYGTFVPLQGTLNIVKAAKLLIDDKQIQFHIIGEGYEHKKIERYVKKHKLHNVRLLGWVNYEKLNIAINEFDICLGIFGSSAKADSVIPNKVFHYAALGKCVISKATPAIREIFIPDQNIILCKNIPQQISAKILELREDINLRAAIGDNAKKHVTSEYNHIQIAYKFVEFLKKCQ